MRTLPDFRTDMIMIRGFLFSGGPFGGEGLEGCAESSVMRTCVI